MPKNVVFIHLESVSQASFWQYSAEMRVLFSLSQRSAFFSRFFATSTSSVMSMSDLLHGDSSMLDHLEIFPRDGDSLRGGDNLFAILHEAGYATHGIQYGSFCLGDAPNNFWGIWPKACGPFQWSNDLDSMHAQTRDFLAQSVAAGQPFALYFWNMNTHLRDEDPRRKADTTYHEQFREGYRLLDASVGRLLADLENLGALRDTVIVAFGDHGDDLWRHGVYRGRSHIIDPYANVCWCPLFIYHNDSDICVSPQLISMVDLKPTLLAILLPERSPDPAATPFAGVNCLTTQRQMAFTQSMFALQKEKSDPARAITKSYAVTNGDLRLMASCPVDMDDSGGLELFLEQWDSGNTRNILDFCKLNNNGNIVEFGSPDAVHPHFFMTFAENHVRNLGQTYEQLRGLLRHFVKLKEAEALKHFKGDKPHFFPDDVFTRKRRRTR